MRGCLGRARQAVRSGRPRHVDIYKGEVHDGDWTGLDWTGVKHSIALLQRQPAWLATSFARAGRGEQADAKGRRWSAWRRLPTADAPPDQGGMPVPCQTLGG